MLKCEKICLKSKYDLIAGYELVRKQKRFDGIKPDLHILENECLETLYNENIYFIDSIMAFSACSLHWFRYDYKVLIIFIKHHKATLAGYNLDIES